MDLKFNATGIDFIKKMKSWVDKKDKYFLSLNACKINYLRIIKVTLGREPSQVL